MHQWWLFVLLCFWGIGFLRSILMVTPFHQICRLLLALQLSWSRSTPGAAVSRIWACFKLTWTCTGASFPTWHGSVPVLWCWWPHNQVGSSSTDALSVEQAFWSRNLFPLSNHSLCLPHLQWTSWLMLPGDRVAFLRHGWSVQGVTWTRSDWVMCWIFTLTLTKRPGS